MSEKSKSASEAVLEVARELREIGSRQLADGSIWDVIENAASRLESAAPGMGTPGEVFVIRALDGEIVSVLASDPGHAREEQTIQRWQVHGTPQPKADAGECEHETCTYYQHWANGPVDEDLLKGQLSKALQRAESAERTVDEDSDRLVEAKRERDVLRKQLAAQTERAETYQSESYKQHHRADDAEAENSTLAERVRELEGEIRAILDDATHERSNWWFIRLRNALAPAPTTTDLPPCCQGCETRIQNCLDDPAHCPDWAEAHKRADS